MIEHLDGIHETVTYKENSSLRLFVNTDCEDYPIHWHTPMEIIMPLEGTYTVFLGDKPVLLQEGDIIFICPGILHSLVAPENELFCRLNGRLCQKSAISIPSSR